MLTNEPKPKISSVFSRETMLYILIHKFKPKKNLFYNYYGCSFMASYEL